MLTADQIYAQEIESEKYQATIYVDTYYSRLIAYEGYKHEVLALMGKLPRDARVLDVGCGTGWFLSLLGSQGWTDLSGLDISPDMLAIAKEMIPQAKLHQAPIEEFSPSTGVYDVITCLGTLHHMPNLERVAGKLYELLAPGGTLIIHEPNEDWFYESSSVLRGLTRVLYAPLRAKNARRVNALRKPWKDIPASPHHEDIPIDDLIAAIKQSGLTVERIQFGNTLMRVLEGMLFRESKLDQRIYKGVKVLDRLLLDRIATRRAGSALVCLRRSA